MINISKSGISNLDDCLADFSDVIRKSCQPVCTSWLETELDLLNSKPNKVFWIVKVSFYIFSATYTVR